MERPEFLKQHHENGQTIVTAFQALPKGEAERVDRWLVWAVSYGSVTWQENCLYEWINESWDLEEAFGTEAG